MTEDADKTSVIWTPDHRGDDVGSVDPNDTGDKEVYLDTALSIKPDHAPVRAPLLDDDIEMRRGNYIITFGFPGSGKTTFQSSLLRYLFHVGPFATEPMHEVGSGSAPNFESSRVITQWMEQWRAGTFPKSNAIGEHEIREIAIRVQPVEGVKTELELGMLEVSGEMMQSVIPTDFSEPKISRVVQSYLANPHVNLAIILLVNPEVDDNDSLFLNLLTYLDANLPHDVRERSGLMLLVSKPDAALKKLKEVDRNYAMLSDLKGDAIEDYIEKFCPATYRFWDQWPSPKKKMIGRVYLGEIEQDGDKAKLIRPDFRSVENIFSWIYTHFTGRRLGPGRFRRLLNWLVR